MPEKIKSEKLKYYAMLARVHKPLIYFLLIWPTLWALWLAANGQPSAKIVGIFIIGALLMRSAGCVLNDIIDREFDKKVTRTRNRPLAAKKIKVKEAFCVLIILLSLAGSLLFFLHRLTIFYALIGLIITSIYPFLKRITYLPQLGLGIAFSWGIPMAFAEEMGRVPLDAWLLFTVAVIWPVIYDTIYALADEKDDRKIGIKSTAILFGRWQREMIGLLQIIFLLLLSAIGVIFQLNLFYFSSLLISAFLFSYQQKLITQGDSATYFKAFVHNHWVGLVIFVGILLSYPK